LLHVASSVVRCTLLTLTSHTGQPEKHAADQHLRPPPPPCQTWGDLVWATTTTTTTTMATQWATAQRDMTMTTTMATGNDDDDNDDNGNDYGNGWQCRQRWQRRNGQ
jgi:hypothetical protein